MPTETELHTYVDKLRKTHLFVGTGDEVWSIDKQYIFLTLVGLKPVSGVVSGHWGEPTPTGRTSVADSMDEVSDFLASLGLAFKLELTPSFVRAYVAGSDELLQQYETASAHNDIAAFGRLFGYPATAVDAFVNGTSTDSRNLEHVYFRLSPDHYEEEIAVAMEWQKLLKEYGLA